MRADSAAGAERTAGSDRLSCIGSAIDRLVVRESRGSEGRESLSAGPSASVERVSVRSLGTSGVDRRTASGVRGGEARVIKGASSAIGFPNSGNSGVGAAAGIAPISDVPPRSGSGDERLKPASTSARSASGCGVFDALERIERSGSAGEVLSEKS